MREIIDFLINALPWIAIGLFVACSCVQAKAKSQKQEVGRFFTGLSWFPAVCFLFVAVMEMLDGNTSSGTTWLVLGVFNMIVNYANSENEKNE